jgi:hypothetical protein
MSTPADDAPGAPAVTNHRSEYASSSGPLDARDPAMLSPRWLGRYTTRRRFFIFIFFYHASSVSRRTKDHDGTPFHFDRKFFVLFREVIPFLGSRWAYLSDSDEGY